MRVDPERIIKRMIVAAVITMLSFKMMTGTTEMAFAVLTWFAMMLFVQEKFYDMYRSLKKRQSKKKKSARRNQSRKTERKSA